MSQLLFGRLRMFAAIGVIIMQITSTSVGAETDSPDQTKDTELEAKRREADLAEAEARLQKALKEIAESKKGTQTASNEELARAEQGKAKALAEQAMAEAEKAKFSALLPSVTSKPLEGKVDLDQKAGYFAEILAYESVQDNASKIAEAIAAKIGSAKKIYFVKPSDFLQSAVQAGEIKKRLETFENTFIALLDRYKVTTGQLSEGETPALLALAAAPAVIGALADVAAMFRVDRSIQGRETKVLSEFLALEVARALQENPKISSIEVVQPSLITQPNTVILTRLREVQGKADKATLRLAEIRQVSGVNSVRIESVQGEINETKNKLVELAKDISSERKDIKDEIKALRDLFEKVPPEKPEERKRLEAAIKEQKDLLNALGTREADMKKRLEKQITDAKETMAPCKFQKDTSDRAIAQFEPVLKAFSEFTNKLVSVPEGGKTPPLATLAEIDVLGELPDDALILTVTVGGQGGEVETRKSIWTSGRIYHRAGSACYFLLSDKHGRIIHSGGVVSNRQTKEGKPIDAPQTP